MKKPIEPLSELLQKAPWLRELASPVRERVVADAYETHHDEKEFVARKGEPVHSWIGVADGLLKVSGVFRSGKGVMFSGIPPGAWVGEGSVLKRELRRYDIVAMRRTRLIHIPRATFGWLLETSFEFNHFIINHLNERLGQFMAMVETDRLTDPVARVARAICSLFNPVLYPGAGPFVQVSQEEIGELAGLTRQRANGAIHCLQDEGLLRVEYGGLLVTDLVGLRRYEDG